MTGYSGTLLEQKLGVGDGDVVFLDGPPADFELAAETTYELPEHLDAALTFHTRRDVLERRLPQLLERMEPAGMVWVCWPEKAAAKRHQIDTDLDDNAVRETGLAAGVVDVKVCAIDDIWSGLKFVRRLSDR